ncbi:location of vulva defective 1-like isoform X1 [Haliotis rufescens]|uniref:location of vulva defective 1-like isoform X1 n=1 Tax=Haliotis rufescens TaxID=6454 RepID=UPI00201EFAB8|nr:location of vulva defective 1-like isoform X1 [Haliotis rufescens]
MDNLYILLFVLCCGVVGFVNGSLQLTTFPSKATEGNAYTLMFSSTNNISASKITWYWRNVSVVETTFNDTCDVVVVQNAYFDTYLSKRVSISCGVLQHNLTLRINSTVDNGTLWYCNVPRTGETSQTVTIAVTDEPTRSTSVTTTPASATSTITTDEEIVSSTSSHISTSTGTGTGNETASTPATSSPTSTDTTQSVGQTSVTSTKPENQLPIIYIAVGGSIAVVIIIVIVVSIVLLRRRKARTVKLADDDKVVKTTEV